MNIDRILASAPINQTAARVTASCRKPAPVGDLSRTEIVEIIKRLERKARLLKVVLGVDTKAKHRNLVYKVMHNMETYRGRDNPRGVAEYVRIGQELHRMAERLRELRLAELELEQFGDPDRETGIYARAA